MDIALAERSTEESSRTAVARTEARLSMSLSEIIGDSAAV